MCVLERYDAVGRVDDAEPVNEEVLMIDEAVGVGETNKILYKGVVVTVVEGVPVDASFLALTRKS